MNKVESFIVESSSSEMDLEKEEEPLPLETIYESNAYTAGGGRQDARDARDFAKNSKNMGKNMNFLTKDARDFLEKFGQTPGFSNFCRPVAVYVAV